jgi:hypothetical protein
MEYLAFFPLSIKKLSMAVEELSVILVGKLTTPYRLWSANKESS